MTSCPIHAQLAYERYFVRRVYYQRSVVCVFRWNVRRTNSRPIHAPLAYERYSARRVYYQRSVVTRFPLERTTDN
jgi:hypothetical protein